VNIAIIGASGHVEYAISQPLPEGCRFIGWAPGVKGEELRPDLDRFLIQNDIPILTDWKSAANKADLVVVNPHFHKSAEITLWCLENGKHVFAEKPLSFKLKELEQIGQVIKENQSHLMAMHFFRYHPAFSKLQSLVDENVIGELVQIVAQKSYKMGEKPDWMKTKADFGGIIPWVGAHIIDQVLGLCSGNEKTKLKSISALQTTTGNNKQGEIESSAVCLFELNNGGQAVCHMDYLRADSASSHGDDRIRVAGKQGVLEVINERLYLDEKEVALSSQPNMFADFIDSILNGKHPRITPEDSIEVSRLCLLADTAANSGKKIML
jgi:predicted dehydrogenase